jgi:branched-chain amino acid transport system substrate-binding protein
MSTRHSAGVRMSRRRILTAGLALGTLPLPFVRTQAAAPIRVGFPTALTGAYREEALDQVRGAQTALAMFNEHGGLDGRLASLITRDVGFDHAKAISATQDLIGRQKVDFLVGSLSASVQLTINDVAKQNRILFNSVSQSDAIVGLPDWSRYTFHQADTPHATAGAVGRYVFPKYGKRVAFLTADYAYGDEMVRGFLGAGDIEVVSNIRHAINTADFRPFLKIIAARKPDVLCLCNFGADQQRAIEQAHKMGLKKNIRLVAPVLLYTTRKAAGNAVFDGVIGGTSYYWRLEDTVPSANTFNRRFRAITEGRVPTAYGALGFAGVMTVLNAVKIAGTTDTDKVIQAMEGLKYDLYKGPEYYRACDHQAVQSLFIIESRPTVNENDMDVFSIVQTIQPDENLLETCSELGHG